MLNPEGIDGVNRGSAPSGLYLTARQPDQLALARTAEWGSRPAPLPAAAPALPARSAPPRSRPAALRSRHVRRSGRSTQAAACAGQPSSSVIAASVACGTSQKSGTGCGVGTSVPCRQIVPIPIDSVLSAESIGPKGEGKSTDSAAWRSGLPRRVRSGRWRNTRRFLLARTAPLTTLRRFLARTAPLGTFARFYGCPGRKRKPYQWQKKGAAEATPHFRYSAFSRRRPQPESCRVRRRP